LGRGEGGPEVVFLDANVLYSACCRDLLVEADVAGLCACRWSAPGILRPCVPPASPSSPPSWTPEGRIKVPLTANPSRARTQVGTSVPLVRVSLVNRSTCPLASYSLSPTCPPALASSSPRLFCLSPLPTGQLINWSL